MERKKLEQLIQFYPLGGKGEVLKVTNYERVFSDLERGRVEGRVLILIDGDKEYIETENRVEELLKRLEEDKEKRGINAEFQYHINCDPTTREGAIEDLLLSAIPERLRDCYTDFLDCLEQKKEERGLKRMKMGNLSKELLKRFFEIENPPYDPSNPNLSPLISKLKWVIGEN
jgi:hypothetical protein